MSTSPDGLRQQALDERYGRNRRSVRRRRVVVASGVLAVVALGWLAWVTWAAASPQAQSRLDGYEVVDPRLATATVTVQLSDPSVEASCLVRATAADSSVVGEQSFPVTGLTGPRRLSVEVRTEREATNVENVGCSTPDQPRPR
ncbi:DUF4307 domain-containing protein [Nocardioides marmoraquaticus]